MKMTTPSVSVLALAKQLIQKCSITPNDAGCQALIASLLQKSGFFCRDLPFGPVSNLWATHGSHGPTLCLVGHTDVVPPGDESAWHFPPFTPTEHEGYLYGRGAQDMKGPLAALVVAALSFVQEYPHHKGRLALLITSDEEGPSIDGTAKALQTLYQEGERITFCLVGEPSSEQHLGDTIKRGRRGSLSGTLTISGIQGHVAYPDKAKNPIHEALPFLEALTQSVWEPGHAHFPPTHLQISNIHAGTGVANVIPGKLQIQFNLRYHPNTPKEQLQEKIVCLLQNHGLKYELSWHSTGGPFFTEDGPLLKATEQAILHICGSQTKASTVGGTSDGRFFAPLGAEVIELGCCNDTIHQVNERVLVKELEALPCVYTEIFKQLLL